MRTNRKSPRNAPHRLAVAAVAALVLAGCGDDSASDAEPTSPTVPAAAPTTAPAPSPAPAAAIEVTEVWARSSPSMASAGAAYLVIGNHGDTDDALVGARVDPAVAGKAEIHEMAPASEVDADDAMHGAPETPSTSQPMGGTGSEMMVMRQIERLDVPAGSTVVLEPGGYHVMLLDLVEPLVVGDSFELTLVFEGAGELTVTADVRDMAP